MVASAAAPTTAATSGIDEEYQAFGAVATLFRLFAQGATEIVLSGPSGTGKSRGCLEYLNYLAMTYPNVRLLLVRKTRRSLTESGMVTLERKVHHPAQGVVWHAQTQQYRYPNGAIIAVCGMDKASKIMSSEWDVIYVQEATELSENEWEACTTRLRNGALPVQQMIADCNPDSPTHWLKLRAEAGRTVMLESRHEDNPTVTPAYLAVLDELTGVRRLRYRLGLWAAAEGMVYQDSWDRSRNIVRRATICRGDRPEDLYGDCGIDRTWPRYIGVDFGFTHPFVAKWYAVDPDGRLWMYRELYMTHKLVEDHARDMLRTCGWELRSGRCVPTGPRSDVLPYAMICDHDAEDRHTLTRHLGLPTIPAYKSVSDGIQAVAARLRPAGDGKPRLVYLEGSLLARDPWLVEHKLPLCGAEEVEGYVWNTSGGKARGEEPVKESDHALDVDRYIAAALDLRDTGVSYVRNVW